MTTDKTEKKIHRLLRGPHAEWFIAFIAFAESSIMPILIEPFLVMMILARPERWFRYVNIVTIASVLGGIVGYLIGALFFGLVGARLIALYGLEEEIAKTIALFDKNVFIVMFIGAFTPIPFKIFAIIGGFLKINFGAFIIASILGRFARFALVGFVTERFGKPVMPFFARHANSITAVIVAGVLLFVAVTIL